MFSTELFENNTNLTYPTKALLLLTGSFPGLDSQVRKGLANVGIRGFSSTQNLVSSLKNPKEVQKLLLLNRILSLCWEQNSKILNEGVKLSRHRNIVGYLHSPGRVFDVLLFMGGTSFRYDSPANERPMGLHAARLSDEAVAESMRPLSDEDLGFWQDSNFPEEDS